MALTTITNDYWYFTGSANGSLPSLGTAVLVERGAIYLMLPVAISHDIYYCAIDIISLCLFSYQTYAHALKSHHR
ncbi:hypothetical protein BDB00DRAFT_860752 [Zychaea mexicana]|uniref:uncharacterized protein n=1 Tax=Zychaea mexicana TaxID=64656 RepID=UPI0022FEFC69|nr:uncharacterized protein BDB00DRAFT_860752 [Zychaea mexicana]KAI9472940.1 hypothetical protein BDB00DRAFT_860752 [Zychaea mexicana]